ncbi:hypothetical protein H6P81_000766 [Aristolochia fimbriata]|uniref:Response regulatory domain-containing protein n=1 Tax=Aristolochia fimbriata TaxID=158543 RepID=A0AAV7F9M1_ARIFI|nr:hypothetical protein H6P81_000766 [Aristolochia fimbriata]
MAEGSLTTTASLFYPPRTPPGIHVMIVDSDCSYLTLAKKLLLVFRYQVKIFANATHAWQELQRRCCKVDIFLIDVQLPDFSGFELIDKIKNKWINVPVIMCSSNEDEEALKRVADQNGCFYMTKPASVEDLENLWKYVGWRRIDKGIDLDMSTRDEAINETSASQIEITSKNNKKKIKLQVSAGKKKAQFLWTFPLQIRFFKAVNKLGLHKAIPTDIINMMKVPKLTRQNVASRLQKYRQFVDKVNEAISAYTKKYIPHMHQYFLEKFSPKEESESEEPSCTSKAKRSKRRKRRRLIDITSDSSLSSVLGESTRDSDVTYSGFRNTEEDEFCSEVISNDVSVLPNIITGASLPNSTAGTSLHTSNPSFPSASASFPISIDASLPIVDTSLSFPSTAGGSFPMVDTSLHFSGAYSVPNASDVSLPNSGSSVILPMDDTSFPCVGDSFPDAGDDTSLPISAVPFPSGGSNSLPMDDTSFPSVGVLFPHSGLSFLNATASVPNMVDTSVPFSGDSFPNITGASVLPNTAGASVLPNIAGASVLPNIAGASVLPNIAGASVLPNIAGASVLPTVDTSFPTAGSSCTVSSASFPHVGASIPMVDTSLPISGASFPNACASFCTGDTSLPSIVDTSFLTAGSSCTVSSASFPHIGASVPMVDTSLPISGASFPNACASLCTGDTSLPNIVDTSFPAAGSSCTVSSASFPHVGASVTMVDTSLPISGASFPNAGASLCIGDTSLPNIVDTSFPVSGASFFIPSASFPNIGASDQGLGFPDAGASLCIGNTSLRNIVDTSFPVSGASFFIPSASFPNIGASDQANGYNTNAFDFGYNNNSERGIQCPNPYITGSSIYNSNTPAAMMSSTTTASSWLRENHSRLYSSGTSTTEFQTNHGGGIPSGVVSNMPPFPVSGASVGNATNMPAVPESYTLERTPALSPAENIPNGFAFEFDGGPYLINEEEAEKLDAILKSGALFDFLND